MLTPPLRPRSTPLRPTGSTIRTARPTWSDSAAPNGPSSSRAASGSEKNDVCSTRPSRIGARTLPSSGKRQLELALLVAIGRHDLGQRAELLAVDHPPALVDEVEAAVAGGAIGRQLDLVAGDDPQPLDGCRVQRGDRRGGHADQHLMRANRGLAGTGWVILSG